MNTNGKDFKGRELGENDRVIAVPPTIATWNPQTQQFKQEKISFQSPRYGRILKSAAVVSVVVWHKGREKGEGWPSRDLIKVPDNCWFNDERIKAFLRLEGLADRFGLE